MSSRNALSLILSTLALGACAGASDGEWASLALRPGMVMPDGGCVAQPRVPVATSTTAETPVARIGLAQFDLDLAALQSRFEELERRYSQAAEMAARASDGAREEKAIQLGRLESIFLSVAEIEAPLFAFRDDLRPKVAEDSERVNTLLNRIGEFRAAHNSRTGVTVAASVSPASSVPTARKQANAEIAAGCAVKSSRTTSEAAG